MTYRELMNFILNSVPKDDLDENVQTIFVTDPKIPALLGTLQEAVENHGAPFLVFNKNYDC